MSHPPLYTKQFPLVILFRKHWYPICFVLILVLSAALHFYNYENRFSIAGDQARDAIVARQGLSRHTIPPLGPFSSAGNFTTGFVWYAWLMMSTALFPGSFLAPWIILSASYIVIVAVMIVIGTKLKGRIFGLITGLFAAVSPAQITQSLNLTNPSLVAVFSALSVLLCVYFLDAGRMYYAFLLGASVSLAISAHFQAIYLFFLIPAVLIARKSPLKSFVVAGIGFLLPFIPYILVDIQTGFYNLRGIIDYQLYGQYKIYIPNRWLTYALGFLPQLWGQVLNGYPWIGYVLLPLLILAFIFAFSRKKISLAFMTIFVSSAVMIILLRYYRGERHFGYFVFFHPLIILLSSWTVYECARFNKYIGTLLALAVLIPGLYTNYINSREAVNITYTQSVYWANILTEKFPGRKFDMYIAGNPPNGKAISLVLYLQSQRKTDNNGYKIGFSNPPKYQSEYYSLIGENKVSYDLWDIDASSSAELKRVGWYNINPDYIYESTTQWYKSIHNSNGFTDLISLLFSKFK